MSKIFKLFLVNMFYLFELLKTFLFFFFLGITAHHILENNFTLYEKLIEQYLIPIINISMKFYPHQQIIWLRLHTSVDQFYPGSFYNEIIDMYNNALSRLLK